MAKVYRKGQKKYPCETCTYKHEILDDKRIGSGWVNEYYLFVLSGIRYCCKKQCSGGKSNGKVI